VSFIPTFPWWARQQFETTTVPIKVLVLPMLFAEGELQNPALGLP
jgi:galactose-1-phosphate uridylyltransferase